MQWSGVKRRKLLTAAKTIGLRVKVNSMVVFKRKENRVTIVLVGSVTKTIPNLVTLRPLESDRFVDGTARCQNHVFDVCATVTL